MSDLDDAFNDACDAAEEVTGARVTVGFRGRNLDAIVSDLGRDPSPMFGGVSDAGSATVAVRLSDIDGEPQDNEPISVRGRELAVLSASHDSATWTITAGDPTT